MRTVPTAGATLLARILPGCSSRWVHKRLGWNSFLAGVLRASEDTSGVSVGFESGRTSGVDGDGLNKGDRGVMAGSGVLVSLGTSVGRIMRLLGHDPAPPLGVWGEDRWMGFCRNGEWCPELELVVELGNSVEKGDAEPWFIGLIVPGRGGVIG